MLQEAAALHCIGYFESFFGSLICDEESVSCSISEKVNMFK